MKKFLKSLLHPVAHRLLPVADELHVRGFANLSSALKAFHERTKPSEETPDQTNG